MAIPVQGGVSLPNLFVHSSTHTDESYIPTDGTSTMAGKGSIMLGMGMLLQRGLTNIGYQVIHDKTLHCPTMLMLINALNERLRNF